MDNYIKYIIVLFVIVHIILSFIFINLGQMHYFGKECRNKNGLVYHDNTSILKCVTTDLKEIKI